MEAEASLKKAGLMYNVLSSVVRSIRMFVFCSHHDEAERCVGKHFGQPVDRGNTCRRDSIELLDLELKVAFDEVLKDAPLQRSTVSNEHSATWVRAPVRLSHRRPLQMVGYSGGQ